MSMPMSSSPIDSGSRVQQPSGLPPLRRARAVRRFRSPGWSWTVGRDWLIPSAVGAASLFLGAALGGLPGLLAGSWADPQTRIQVWAAVALGAIGLAALLATLLMWRGRNGILRENGTAYIIQETAGEWAADDAQAFLASARRQFARTIEVPGPGRLDPPWDWSLGERMHEWDGKATELTRAFQALHSNDGHLPNGIFMWAWAPVAMAFGARVAAADRDLDLDVWQRPSRGRSGDLEIPSRSQPSHRFGCGTRSAALAELLPGSALQHCVWPVQVSIRSHGSQRRRRHPRRAGDKAPVLLLARLGRQSWGPVPEARARTGEATAGAEATAASAGSTSPLTVVLDDAAGLGLTGTFCTEIRELRILPPPGERLFPWLAYPSLVAEISSWIRCQAAKLPDRLLLMGTIVPPEVALGLGIDSVQISKSDWPANLWPILHQPGSGALVIPRLNLGTAALPRAFPADSAR